MKICFIGDANSIHTQRWVRWFAKRHEVLVISTLEGDGLPEHKVAALSVKEGHGLRLVKSVAQVRRILREHQPDILHCHFINEAGWFGMASGWRPLVVTAWGSDVYRAPGESSLARLLNPLTVRRASWVTCDSADQATEMREWGVSPDRLSVIGWGVDRQEFNPQVDGTSVRQQLDIPLDAPVVLSPRQWYANSNIPTIVAAHEQLPDDTYLIVKRQPGFEPDNGAAVKRAIAASSARGRVRVVERIEASELPALYASSDLAVSLCTTDGTPVSVLEAMAVGLPVVAFSNPSLEEWVTPPGGALVPRLDAGDVAEAIRRFLFDRLASRRAGEHNLNVIRERADRSVEFGRMNEIYERLFAGEVAGRASHGN